MYVIILLYLYCVRRELQTFACHQQMQDGYDKQDIYVSDMKNFACKHHYLVSTKAQPGVYNSPFQVGYVFARDSIYAIARICYRPSVRLSVRLFARHIGGSVKNG